MFKITKYPLKSKQVQTINIREDYQILDVHLENDKSDPELYILENLDSDKVYKNILICQELFDIEYSIDELTYIGKFSINKGLHKFFVFEVHSNIIKTLHNQHIKIEDLPKIELDMEDNTTIQKWARIPKPDLDKIYSKEELSLMHPERQLKYLLINKYELKGRIRNKLSIEGKIDFILRKQNGEEFDPYDLIDEREEMVIPKENVERIIPIDSPEKTYKEPISIEYESSKLKEEITFENSIQNKPKEETRKKTLSNSIDSATFSKDSKVVVLVYQAANDPQF